MPTKPWRETQERHSKNTPEQRDATRARAHALLELERLSLTALRRARAMTQETIAETAGMAQGDVSKLEHRTDAYIGTVRRFVEALGGSLRMVVEFPDAAPVEIEGFGAQESAGTDWTKARAAAHGAFRKRAAQTEVGAASRKRKGAEFYETIGSKGGVRR